jgi:hypothetical protein
MRCYQRTALDDAARLRVCPVVVAAAISLGDYNTYMQIEAYLREKAAGKDSSAAYAELALATAAVSVIAPNMAPEWLKKGDLSALHPQAWPLALYLRAKYFQCVGQFEAMLAVAETVLSLSSPEGGITPADISAGNPRRGLPRPGAGRGSGAVAA